MNPSLLRAARLVLLPLADFGACAEGPIRPTESHPCEEGETDSLLTVSGCCWDG